MGKVLNFDKFMEEKNGETVEVTVYGKKYNVACRIPASVPVMMARAENEIDGQLATKLVMMAADAMFGKNAIDEFCRKGMSANELSDLVQRMFGIINGKEEDDEAEELSDEDSKRVVRGKNEKK